MKGAETHYNFRVYHRKKLSTETLEITTLLYDIQL